MHSQVSNGGIQTSHLACYLGNLEILRILKQYFNASFDEKSDYGLTGLHCAAANTQGIVSIFYLKDQGYDLEAQDKFGATPLHYAVIRLVQINIKAIISLDGNVNAQDNEGESCLHLAITSYIEIDQQINYEAQKEVFKLILQFLSQMENVNRVFTFGGTIQNITFLTLKLIKPKKIFAHFQVC